MYENYGSFSLDKISFRIFKKIIKFKIETFFHRYNLDPDGTKTDKELWSALEVAQLKQPVNELPEKLGELFKTVLYITFVRPKILIMFLRHRQLHLQPLASKFLLHFQYSH